MQTISMDRFEVGLEDQQNKPLDLVGICPCGCREAIYFGDDGVWELDGDKYASAECVAKAVGAERMDHQWA